MSDRKDTLRIHLICNAHLDPVWQWRWDEGCAETIATFRTAARLLREHGSFIFNHNESVLYRWVECYAPDLFEEIRQLVAAGRWFISGGWYLQPDANIPGPESFIRHISEGRRYFRDRFGVAPRVAYNFDSFGHHGGLPQILTRAGYHMYIHMRPWKGQLELPADLYRWRGVDGSEILTLRIEVGIYHTEHDNIETRLREGIDLGRRLGRDVAVFWGLGDHGGGATRETLAAIDAFMDSNDSGLEIIHSTPDQLAERLLPHAQNAPIVEGDIQRVFTGCYTSLSRIKRRARSGLARLVRCEAHRAATWWLHGQEYPAKQLEETWRHHLFNDFHDILPGSCTAPAEADALDLYGRAAESARELRLNALASYSRRAPDCGPLPVTVLHSVPSLRTVPVEVEYMMDHRPLRAGTWHTRIGRPDGTEVPCQEEQPESILPVQWRRKLCFLAELPGLGAAHFRIDRLEGKGEQPTAPAAIPHQVDPAKGLLSRLEAPGAGECLAGPLLEPLVIEDTGDSWGTDLLSYRNVVGKFTLDEDIRVAESGPVRTITESLLSWGASRLLLRTVAYADWPAIEFRFRLLWCEPRKRLELSIPTVFQDAQPLCEIPGGALYRPADGDEHVHARWLLMEGETERGPAALGVVNSGQHGLDCRNGTVTLSVLRSAAYCHEQGQSLEDFPGTHFMDLGEHEFRVLVTAGAPNEVRSLLPGLADWIDAPPTAVAHWPTGVHAADAPAHDARDAEELLVLEPRGVTLLACKRSEDGEALIIRIHEALGRSVTATLRLHEPACSMKLQLRPFEIRTVRVERDGIHREVGTIEEVS